MGCSAVSIMKRHHMKAVRRIMMILAWIRPGWAEAGVSPFEAEEAARLVAALLDSGREVIDRNQALIDDPHKGNKGFTPRVFERQLIEEFRLRTGVDLTNKAANRLPVSTIDLLLTLVNASKTVVADAQGVINQRGVGYKNFIPATFGSQAAARFRPLLTCASNKRRFSRAIPETPQIHTRKVCCAG